MKIRHGFVSNSSTSSFCIFGVPTNHKELVKILCGGKEKEPVKYQKCNHVFDRDTMQYCPTCGQLVWGMDNSDWDSEDFDELLKAKKLSAFNKEGDYYVGEDVSGMKYEDLVKLNEVADNCKELFGKAAKVHSGAYYN